MNPPKIWVLGDFCAILEISKSQANDISNQSQEIRKNLITELTHYDLYHRGEKMTLEISKVQAND